MTRTRKAKERDDLVHLFRLVHRTEKTSRKDVARREIHVIIGMFPNVQNSNLETDAGSKTSMHTNTQLNLFMKGNFSINFNAHSSVR